MLYKINIILEIFFVECHMSSRSSNVWTISLYLWKKKLDRGLLNIAKSVTSELKFYITGRIITRAHRAHSSYLYVKRVVLTAECIFF